MVFPNILNRIRLAHFYYAYKLLLHLLDFVMNKLKLIVLITGILIAGLAFSASAQTARAEKTSSAKAYYGKAPGKPNFTKANYKDKRKKAVKARHHTKPAKGTTRADRWSLRRKNSNS